MQRIAKTFTAIIAVAFVFGAVIALVTILAGGDLAGDGSGGLWLLPNKRRAEIENQAREDRLRIDTDEKEKLAAMRIEGAKAWQPVGFTANVLFVTIILGTISGCGIAVVVWANTKSVEIHADSTGLFPIVRIKVGGSTVIHDPNRALTASTVYTPAEMADQVRVVPVLCEAGKTQTMAALGALAVQATAAANRHAPAMPSGQLPMLINQPGQELPQPDYSQLWPSRVPLRGLLDGAPSLARLVLGITVNETTGANEVIRGDLSKMVHILTAGASGWGKSEFLRMLVLQLATSVEPCGLVLADMERVTFGAFGQCSRLMYPVIDNEHDLSAVFGELDDELHKRRELFYQFPEVDSLGAYNARAKHPLAPVVLAIDEATSFLADGAVSDGLKNIARRGRKFGLWCLLGGQTFGARDVDSATSLQFSSRVQFRAPVKSGSQTLVNDKDARGLEVPGRAIIVLPGQDAIKVQTPQVGYSDILAAMSNEGGPQRTMPAIETGPGQADDQAVRIRELAQQGRSQRQIELELFGYTGGNAHHKVASVLTA